jgi:nucleotide-binding universal stress UspA family protein
MALETILVIIGKRDNERLDELASITTDIAGPACSSVALAHVFTQEEYKKARENLKFNPDSEVTPDIVAMRYLNVQVLTDAMEDAGVTYTTHGQVAKEDAVVEGIVALTEDVGADLVVIGGRRRSAAGKAVFGSVAHDVLMNAPCPIVFVRGD